MDKQMKMPGAKRKSNFYCFWLNHIYPSWNSLMFRVTVTLNTEQWNGCVGLMSFLAEIKVFWKCWAYSQIKMTWINHTKLLRVLDLDFWALMLISVSPQNGSKSECTFLKELLYHGGTPEGKKTKTKTMFFNSRHLRVSNSCTKQNFALNYHLKVTLERQACCGPLVITTT